MCCVLLQMVDGEFNLLVNLLGAFDVDSSIGMVISVVSNVSITQRNSPSLRLTS